MSSVLNLFGFAPAAELTIELENVRARIKHPADKSKELMLFQADEPVKGVFTVTVLAGKTLDYTGMKIEVIGLIEMPHERSSTYEFTSLLREIDASNGSLSEGAHSYPFNFSTVEKPHESYYGKSVRLRYYLRATITRSYASNLVKEQDFWVQIVGPPPPLDSSIKMEVGIEDCLHIEFEYDKSKYHLKDVVVGKVFFLLVRIKIKHMELAIIRREFIGSGSDTHNESETLTKFEIMDGAPVKGESIPVRLYLAPYNLTPTYRNIQNKFSIKYFLNLVLVDEEDRRYFKQQEISIWRKVMG